MNVRCAGVRALYTSGVAWEFLPDSPFTLIGYCIQVESVHAKAVCRWLCYLCLSNSYKYQKAQMKGRTELTALVAASSVTSSVHQHVVTTHPRQSKCPQCGYSHPEENCPASGQQCYNCNGFGHYTALCKKTRTCQHNHHQGKYKLRGPSSHRYNSRSSSWDNSKSPTQGRPDRSPSRSPSHIGSQHRSPPHTSRIRWG